MPKLMGKRGIDAQKPKNIKGTMFRLIKYLKPHRGKMALAIIGILISAFSNIAGTAILAPLLNGLAAVKPSDDLVLTGIAQLDALVFQGVAGKIQYLTILVCTIAAVYVLSLIANYMCNRLLVSISTTTMTTMRNELFSHMQKLPIKVFDTTTHGELMTRFTNDVDVMNEFIARCIPQMISSVMTILGVFTMMFVLNWILALIMVCMLVVMLVIVKFIGGKSQKNFVAQQQAVGKLNGYIEELVEGQKVVKAFNHEQAAVSAFDVINSHWQEVSGKANGYANIMGPIMNNVSHFFYAAIAISGAFIAISSNEPLGFVGIIATFLMYIRNITNPIQQIAQQINLVFMALAGGERVFELLDTPVEVDDGYVTLVNADIDGQGNITESQMRTGRWAWKHPHHETGEITYTELKGDVRFEEVTFGYEENKTVLQDVSLFAKPGQKIAFVGSTGAGKTTITNLIKPFFTTCQTARYATTVSISIKLKRRICANLLQWFYRIRTCLRAL